MPGNIHRDLRFLLKAELDTGWGEVNDCHGSLHLDRSLSPFRLWLEQEGKKWSNGRMGMGVEGRGTGREERWVE